jgi:hypothetical protein
VHCETVTDLESKIRHGEFRENAVFHLSNINASTDVQQPQCFKGLM